ncbi:unnamed protein product [Dibothriocephalus latus]|uniref:PB1 domain-containing protein n=1 Tax=Dibothriocephalus latus TaxID=60516 RepID=A0A3P7PVK2_DIBLA|nr:unnamed protein product [Dibothriocephalus latus]
MQFSSGDGSQSYCQFSVDPKLTTYDVLVDLISRRFEVTGDFKISYLVMDKYGEQSLLPLHTDFDLDAAIFASSDRTLRLFIETKSKSDDDWDIVGPGELSVDRREIPKRAPEPSPPFPPGLTAGLRSLANVPFLQSISQQVGKTVTSIEKAIGNCILPNKFLLVHLFESRLCFIALLPTLCGECLLQINMKQSSALRRSSSSILFVTSCKPAALKFCTVIELFLILDVLLKPKFKKSELKFLNMFPSRYCN